MQVISNYLERRTMNHFPIQISNLPEYKGAFDARKLTAENCDILFASYPAGKSIPPHTHDTDNVGIVTNGEMYLTLDDKEVCVATGEWYRVPLEAVHAARFERETSIIEFWFHKQQAQ